MVEGVTVLSCGKRVSEHEWESTRPELGALLNELRMQYDVLLVDSAPPVLVHDTLAICSLVDAVVVVVNSVTYDARQLLDTKRLLEQAGANIVGAVINRVEPYGTYSYYYDRRYGPREAGRQSGDLPRLSDPLRRAASSPRAGPGARAVRCGSRRGPSGAAAGSFA
jgi:hypothetical protein